MCLVQAGIEKTPGRPEIHFFCDHQYQSVNANENNMRARKYICKVLLLGSLTLFALLPEKNSQNVEK